MKIIMQWLLKTVLVVVLISGMTLLTTGLVVNAYVQSILTTFNIKLEGQTPGLGSIMQGMFGFGKQKDKDMTTDPKDTASNEKSTGTVQGSSSSDRSSGTGSSSTTDQGKSDTSGEKVEKEKVPENAVPVMGQGVSESESVDSQGTGTAQDEQVLISPEDMSKKKQELTAQEKKTIFTMLITKLPQQEIQAISSEMEGGLTEEELKNIESTIAQYLNAEEYESLKKLLEK
ncbi:hypothetical protein [Paenibacillus pini]|uniref:Uncharacterized protein n=1 Tax=Paenibacillus pini JCM 16418 TaxID=1236976 RepID=W7Z1L3_9BACL|nr:hypothetical protein [Paenibacillus pini]GAF08264.1 hypothetical protein JCM16418_2326 [Paenibacillus pini JCM 16418]